jgi:lipopolysaccharide export LptBFGC system permease protein LptF
MNRIIENILVVVAGFLLVAILVLIVLYNTQNDNMQNDIFVEESTSENVVKKDNKIDYLKNLEGYSDVNVDVDPQKRNSSNIVDVKEEKIKSNISYVVDDKSKSSYMENLENYDSDSNVTINNKDNEEEDETEKTGIIDEIGMAIDAALDDI